ncbi:hypothetical protein V3468_05400 [Flavobacterium oreochromis]|uniref:hypothetical protein n=1 Tax=Flavobacterium oreochromis TaxID=2906078 RepID=UPI00385C00A9
MNKLGLVITDGVGYRNFILSDFLTIASENFSEVIILSCLPKLAYDDLNLNVTIIELPVFEEGFFTWFFRKTKEIAHLKLHLKDNFGIYDNLNTNHNKNKTTRGWATRRIYDITKFWNSEKWILRFEKLQKLTFVNHKITKSYGKLLKETQIDVLFFTHQRPPYIAPLTSVAKKLNIPTVAFIFSWDNLASKGRMAFSFDHYLVWSQLMKNELLEFYTSIQEKQVEVVGTPQFEPYVLERYGWSKEDFLTKFQLAADKKIILFSCGDVSTSPNDPIYIEVIAKAIVNNKLEKTQLIVRTSPAETPERFQELALKYPFIKWNFPKWVQARSNHQEAWSQRIPTVEDISDLKSVLKYCDVCVNMLSTMSLDAILFDKPVINTVFGDGKNGLVNDQRFLHYRHIQQIIQTGAVDIAEKESELISKINVALADSTVRQKQQLELINLEIGIDLEKTNSIIIAELLNKTS